MEEPMSLEQLSQQPVNQITEVKPEPEITIAVPQSPMVDLNNLDQSKWMNHSKARQIKQVLGTEAAKIYLRAYFRNEKLPTLPAIRRLEFARFFFAEAFNEKSSPLHLQIFSNYSSGQHTGMAAPRGFAKTTCGTVEVVYRVVNELSHYTLVISDTYSQARDIVDNIKTEFESNRLLIWLYGDLRTDWHWTSGSFTTNNQVRVTARGSNMKVRGLKYKHWRPDFAIGDDLENDEMVENPERRLKLMNWIKKALMPAMNKKQRQVSVVGTVLHSDSLLMNVLEGKPGFGGWLRTRYKALNIAEDGTEYSLWPEMFSVEWLKAVRDNPLHPDYMGPLVFAQEMQNEPIDEEARIFKREWIYGRHDKQNTFSLTAKEEQWKAEDPERTVSWVKANMVQIILAVDPAISEKTTADYFAMVVIGIDKQGEIWILDIFRDRISDIDKQIERILEFNAEWKPDRIKVEAVAYQAGLARGVQKQAAQRGQHAPVFPVKPDKDKFRRAVIHSANFAGNLVHVRTDHPLSEAFISELLAFPKGAHDDMLDAYMHSAEDQVKRYKTRTFASKPKGF